MKILRFTIPLLGILCVLAATLARAQVGVTSVGVDTGRTLTIGTHLPVGSAGVYVTNLNTALQATAQGNFVQAEAALALNAYTPAGTAQRELETAQSLGTLAFSFHDARNYARAVLVARRALTHLDGTKGIWARADSATLSQANEWAGILEEVVLGDNATAETYYQQAAQLDSKNTSAAQRLRRLKTVDNFAAAKFAGK